LVSAQREEGTHMCREKTHDDFTINPLGNKCGQQERTWPKIPKRRTSKFFHSDGRME